MRRLSALLAVAAALGLAGSAQAAGLPSIYGPNSGPLTLPDGSTHVQRGEGWVQRYPVVHLIFWGSSWTHDTTGIVAAEQTLFRELPGSSYNAILAQYGVLGVRFAGSYFDPTTPPRITLRALAREARRASRATRTHNGAYVQWIILPQSGSDMRNFANECGEHDDLKLGKRTYYVDLIPPYQDALYSDPCVYDYSADNGQRAPGNLIDATTSITSHEYAEAATDPWASTGLSYGWSTGDGNDAEVADLCAWYSAVSVGMTVNASYLWSNSTGGCAL